MLVAVRKSALVKSMARVPGEGDCWQTKQTSQFEAVQWIHCMHEAKLTPKLGERGKSEQASALTSMFTTGGSGEAKPAASSTGR